MVTDRAPRLYHRMEIYRDQRVLVTLVVQLITRALNFKQPALVVTTPETLEAIIDLLRVERVDIAHERDTNQLEMLNANDVLQNLVVDDVPDEQQFRSLMDGIFGRLCGAREFCMPMVYSDMAGILVRQGNSASALALEAMWNRFAVDHRFTLTCGYAASDLFRRVPTLEELQAFCDEHNNVRLLSH